MLAGLHMITAVGTPDKHPAHICRIVRLFDTIDELMVSKSLPRYAVPNCVCAVVQGQLFPDQAWAPYLHIHHQSYEDDLASITLA